MSSPRLEKSYKNTVNFLQYIFYSSYSVQLFSSQTVHLQLYSISLGCLELLAVLGGGGRNRQVRGGVRVRELPFDEDLICQSPHDSSYHGSHQRHPEPVIVTPDVRVRGLKGSEVISTKMRGPQPHFCPNILLLDPLF